MIRRAKIMAVLVVLIGAGSALADLTDGLVAHWKLDGDANDSVGSNHGTIYGAQWTTGQIGGALSFDGNGDYVSLSSNAVTTTEFTVAGWANHYGPGGGTKGQNMIFQQRDNTATFNCSVIILGTEGQSPVAFAGIRSSSGPHQNVTYPKKNYDEWHYYAMTVDLNDLILYIDGVEVDRTSNNQAGDYITSIDHVDIGRHRYSGVDRGFFNGIIDDVRIYDRALSAEEVEQLYEEGRGDLLWLEITGPNEVAENFSASYKAIAYYDDDSTRDVTYLALWSVEPEECGSINENGVLTTERIEIPEAITIYAQYTFRGVTIEAEMTVQVFPSRTLYVPAEYETIQAAIDDSNDGDVVIVEPNTYTGPGNRDIDFLGKAITVRSIDPNDPDIVAATIIDCDGTETDRHRGFKFHSGEYANSIIAGFTITNGYHNYGGGIYCNGSDPTITNCTFNGNSAAYGGGILCGGTPIITNCTFTGNSAEYGGGIYCWGGSPTFANCTISGNFADRGGGICCENGTSMLTNCTFSGNSASYGGGILVWEHSNPTVTNCTFAGNSASYGNLLACWSWRLLHPSNVQMTNCILWDGGNEIWNNDGSTITITYSDVQGSWPGEGNMNANPFFADPCNGDYHLLPDSPCINTGNPKGDYTGQTDIDGQPRVVGARVDMGADEFLYESTLVGLEIAGPEEVAENSSAQYSAIAYDGGYTADVTTMAIWSLEPQECGSINENGVLTTERIEIPETITIYAQYTDNGVTVDAEITVQVSPPVDLEITGPEEVWGTNPAQYEAVVYYDNGQTDTVTDSAIWLAEPQTVANIDAKGLLHTEDINTPEYVTILVQYTAGGSTIETEMTVEVFPPRTLYVPAEYETIQKGIDSADDGDTVIVAPGTYTGPGNRDIDFLGKTITVRSENGPENCIIDCQATEDDQHRGFNFRSGEDANCVLSGFTITNGYAYDGGGIFCDWESSPTIFNCTIIGNSAWIGGGIKCENSSTVIRNCVFNGNYSGGGGGMCVIGGSPTVTNCTFSGNSAEYEGGGILCWDSSPTVTNCTFSNNSAHGFGGGICCWDSSPTITNCTITGNTADYGGGMFCNYSSPTITNCTINGNSVEYEGGGIYCDWSSSPTLTNCTISGNWAEHEGGGICCWGSNPIITNCTITGNLADVGGGIYCGWGSSPTITNCILWGNQAPDGSEIYLDRYSNAWVTYTDVNGGWPDDDYGGCPGDDNGGCPGDDNGGWTGEGNIDSDPCFVQPGYWADVNDANIIVEPNDPNAVWIDGDYHLLMGSPCIDAGDNTAVPLDTTDLDGDGDTAEPIPFDLDGNPRIVGDAVDMGAFEAMVSCFGVNHVKLETKAGKKGNEVELKGTFSPALPIDLVRDDVAYIIDDGRGNALAFLIPAGSFEPEGKPDKQKFRFDSPKHSQPDINAEFDFDKCKFELKAKRVQGTDEITSTTLTIELWAGANVVEEVVQVQVKPRHLEYKREPKLSCCPKCKGIALLEVTSDQGVLVFEPEPSKEKLKRKTVVDDGVNGRVKIDTSCSKPLEVGDVFGVYTVTDLIKIFDD